MHSKFVARARLLSGCFVVAALLLVVRLYFIQIVHGGDYERQAMGQYTASTPDTTDRGTIFFTKSTGEQIAAAVMQAGWRIAIQPPNITDAAGDAQKINAIVPIDTARFNEDAAKKNDPYEEVAFRITDDQATAIRKLKLPGVLLVQDQWRYYPAGELASQAIGFVGYEGTSTTRVGEYGLERQYEDTLSQTTSGLFVNPFAEIFTNVDDAVSSDPAAHQGSIITSIEPNVQSQLEKTLDGVMQKYSPGFAGGIVMDPHSGAMYAVGARPSFDPNTYNLADPTTFSDPLVSGRYELGSIMKPLTMAAGIDSGAVTTKTKYNDTGCIERSGKTICNYDGKARGVIPMQEILNQSLNLGASYVADTMSHPTLTHYFKSYGLGQKTGVDLPGEVVGDISNLRNGSGPDVNFDTAAFGQGIAVTPIEMIRALSALANDGVLANPHVVTAIKYESGVTRSIDPGVGVRVFSTTTAETVTNMLTTVFDTSLLKGALKEEHYSFAAKTGTAQIPQPHGGYIQGNVYLHSFFGYFPAHDPKFIIFLFAWKPVGQEYASATLAQPFADIANFLINYYNIPPDR